MKIALAQMDVKPGRPKKNLETMLRMIEEAKGHKVDLVAFPEMCVGGYLVGDKWQSERFCENLMEFNEEIRKASGGIAVAYGNVYLDKEVGERVGNEGEGDDGFHPNKDGRTRKYNAVYVYQNQKPVERLEEDGTLPRGVQPKTLLPNYRFFDDERYFFSLEDVAKDHGMELAELLRPFLIEVDDDGKEGERKKVPIGFSVCEDLWCKDYRRNGRAQNIVKTLTENGAECNINISASPWTFDKHEARDRVIEFAVTESREKAVPFLYVNCVGAQNNGKNIVTFDGGSTVYNSKGKPIFLADDAYEEEMLIMDTADIDGIEEKRKVRPAIAEKYEAIIRGIRHVKDIRGSESQPRYILGMSGGIDSSLVAALLAIAVGPEKVFGVNMPTKFNSDQTKSAAKYVAKRLGIGYAEVPVGDLSGFNEQVIEQADFDGSGRKLNPMQRGNVAAKVRGTSVISNLAAKYGALFTNNGNKLETALGYATLYGDINGAICPIADLTKAEVFELARYLNKEIFKQEVIPESLIPDELYRFKKDQIPPTAELEEDQIDPMKFGYHDALLTMMTDFKEKSAEDFMDWYLDGTLHEKVADVLGKDSEYGYQLMKRWNVDDPQEFVKDLEWFTKTINWAVFKRVQTGPIIITSKTSYGYDRRESQLPWERSLAYDRLKEKILDVNEQLRYKPANYKPKMQLNREGLQ